jgi:hypothetical protein
VRLFPCVLCAVVDADTLGSCSRMLKFGPKIASHDLRAWIYQTQVPVQHRYVDLFSYKHGRSSLFPAVARQSATHLLAQPSFHLPSQLKDHLPPSRFWLSFLGSALLSSPFCPSSSPPQTGCHRYNPSKVALHPHCAVAPNLFS